MMDEVICIGHDKISYSNFDVAAVGFISNTQLTTYSMSFSECLLCS